VVDSSAFEQVVWLDGDSMDRESLVALETSLALSHPLDELIAEAPARHAVLVLDALDQFSSRALENAITLLRRTKQVWGDGRWSLLITLRLERAELADLLLQGSDAAGLLTPITVEPPSLDEVRTLLSPFAALQAFSLRADVAEVLGNLKILDWLVERVQGGSSWESKVVGHSDLIDWIWSRWIGRDDMRFARNSVLKKLGVSEGDSLLAGVGLSQLSEPESRTLGDLQKLALVRVREDDERVLFQHDLLGDWARLRVLVEEAEERPGILPQHQRTPRWHHAIRLYGQRLLEKGGAASWKAVWDTLPLTDDGTIARDLMLESLVTTTNALAVLETLWPELSNSNGRWLRRLLQRFLWTATAPHPGLELTSHDPETAESLRPYVRVPYWPYWAAFLLFLAAHAEKLADLALRPAVETSVLWLRFAHLEWPLRREAGLVALQLARAIKRNREEFDAREHEQAVATTAFEATLLAAPEFPAEATSLALELCGRTPSNSGLSSGPGSNAAVGTVVDEPTTLPGARRAAVGDARSSRRGASGRQRDPVDAAFRRAVLGTTGLAALAKAEPQVALEVLLACCRDAPREEDDPHLALFHWRNLGIVSEPEWYPPMFFRGPFLLLLRQDWGLGLDAVIRLSNEATQEWDRVAAMLNPRPQAQQSRRLSLPIAGGTQEWIGDGRLLGWYRNQHVQTPLLASALMAAEKWFYDRIDAGEEVEEAIDRILSRSRSVALLGVLTAVGLMKPSLLEGALRPLLGVWQLYEWQDWIVANESVWQLEMSSWSLQGETFFNLARDWHSLPHRKSLLRDIATRLLIVRPGMPEFFAEVRASWNVKLNTLHGRAREDLELLIARFDPSNYQRTARGDGLVEVSFQWPEPIRQRTEEALKAANRKLVLLEFPSRCRQAIDSGYRLTDQECVTLCSQLDEWDTERAQDQEGHGRLLDALVGGIVLIWLSRRDWLQAHPERHAWWRKKLEEISQTPPTAGEFASERDVITHYWHSFIGDLAPALLAEERQNSWAREWAARSVACFWYGTTALTLTRAFHVRQQLGEEFNRLQNLLVLWAGLRHVVRFVGRAEGCAAPSAHWYGRLVDGFVRGRLTAAPLDWVRISDGANRLYGRIMRRRYAAFDLGETADADSEPPRVRAHLLTRKRRRRERPGLDLETIHAGFQWLPKLATATDDAERTGWIQVHGRLLELSLGMLPTVDPQSDEIEGTPYEYDHWVYERLAGLIVQLTDSEDPGQFWRPVLDLGGAGHYWVDTFLDQWFLRGSQAATSPRVFVDHWEAMILYALASPAWAKGGKRWFRVEALWRRLLGLTLTGQSITSDSYAGELARLLPLYERWATDWLRMPQSAQALARFLAHPASKDLRGSALIWLRAALPAAEEQRWWEEVGLEDALVGALRAAWLSTGGRFGGHDSVRQAFLDLLAVLTGRGSPAALDLRDRVARSGGGV
jgi:hypothetical protein